MSSHAPSGRYPIEATHAHELERLRQQDLAWAPDTGVLLQAIGIGPGWHCLDMGCGPRGLTRTFSERVGPAGQVTGLEYNPDFVEIARRDAPDNVRIVQGDAWATGLPGDSFDLVHMRFLASTSGDFERLVTEAVRLVKPGGFLALQEADGTSMAVYPPHPAFARFRDAMCTLVPTAIGEDPAGHKLYRVLLAEGLEDVGYRPCVVGQRAGDPWQDYLPDTAYSLRNAFIEAGFYTEAELERDIADLRAHLSTPGTTFVGPMLVQVWGRKPDTAAG